MADIDKGLPNTRTKLDVPSEEEIAEEIAVQEPEQEKGPNSQGLQGLMKRVRNR